MMVVRVRFTGELSRFCKWKLAGGTAACLHDVGADGNDCACLCTECDRWIHQQTYLVGAVLFIVFITGKSMDHDILVIVMFVK